MMLKLAQTSVFFPRPYEILGKKYKANLVLILTQINSIKIMCYSVIILLESDCFPSISCHSH